MSLDFFRSSKENIHEHDIPEKKLEGTHIMDIYYPDGTKHHVDCYKFAKAVLDDGEEVYFIEYKDYDNKKYGEYADSYGIVVKKDGRWQKSERKLDYRMLSSREIEKYDPKVLGEDLQMLKEINTQSYEQPEGILNEHKIGAPQTQTQPQRDKKPPVGNSKEQNPYIISKEDGYVPQTQTQPLREEILPHHEKVEKREIFICVPTDKTKKFANLAGIKDLFSRGVGLSYKGIQNDVYLDYKQTHQMFEKFYDAGKKIKRKDGENVIDFASFNTVKIPQKVLDALQKQVIQLTDQSKKKGIFNGDETLLFDWEKNIEFSGLQTIDVDDTIYRFVPYNRFHSSVPFITSYERIDIVVDEKDKKKSPVQILEEFFDYSLPMGRITGDETHGKNAEAKFEIWDGYTKDMEIERLRKECEYLRSMNKNYQAQMNTQDAIQDIEDRKAGVRR